jgi:hypothetical protein
MPNWCDNVATITGPASVIKEIKEILKSNDPDLLNYMVPQPRFEGESDWYSWNIENWGTKWEISSPTINEDSDDSISFGFMTAWGPPIAAFETWGRGQENVTFQLDYFEPGMEFVGTATYDGEFFDDECINNSSDSEYYKNKVRDEWGWEEDEEEEPLTEWYKQGVEDKGLNND